MPVSSWSRNWSIAWIAAVLLVFGCSEPASAQTFEPGEGVMRLVDWPDEEARRTLRYDILPFIDTLSVAYRYQVTDGRPALSLLVDWNPSTTVVYRGARVPRSEVPGDVRMVAIDLRADVLVDGLRAATISVVVDSMVVGPAPDYVEINLPDLSWENVFVETSAEEAKAIFLNGFELADPEIAGAAFAVFDEDGRVDLEEEVASRRSPRGQPRRVSIYRAPNMVDVFVDVHWLIGGFSPPSYVGGGEPRKAVGRGRLDGNDRSGRRGRDEGDRSVRSDDDRSGSDVTGRGSRDSEGRPADSGREERDSSERSGSRSEGGFRLPDSGDDDDDDDDDELVPYALAAVGAAGVLAAAGGTIGYFGNSRHAPLGLTSGFVGRDGGLLLQAAVNDAVLFDAPGPERLMVKLLSFGNFLDSGLQPAIGAGVLATTEGEGITYEPSLSLGAVGIHKMFLLYGGYDVLQEGPEFSVGLNLRELGLWGSGRKGRE